MQTVIRVLAQLREWVESLKAPATPDTYEPHEHTDLEPPPYYAPLLGRGGHR